MNTESRRLPILSAEEIDDLYAIPRFTDEDRHLYFGLSPPEREAAGAIHTASVALHLILPLGYFKAKRQFFLYGRTSPISSRRISRGETSIPSSRCPNQPGLGNTGLFSICSAIALAMPPPSKTWKWERTWD